MKIYRVTPADDNIYYHIEAEDEQHAVEQAEYLFPENDLWQVEELTREERNE